ncbi:MAG: hypothetical protein IKS28_07410 [Clostridia bacterium]|nr:hypothetical protein [Clostridia bacterium]
MKKTYSEPKIVFSSFSLSSSVSSGCEAISNHAERVCPVTVDELGGTVFSEDMDCIFTAPEYTDTLCYTNPSDSYNVFSS